MDRQLLDISNQEVLQNIFGVYPDEYHEICFQVILCVIFYAYRFLNFKVKYIPYCIKFSLELIFAIFAILLKSAKISSREVFQNRLSAKISSREIFQNMPSGRLCSRDYNEHDGNVFDLFQKDS